MTGILLRKGEETGRIPCDDKGRGWNDDSTSQGMQSKHQKLERGKEGSFHGPIREIMAQLTPWFQTSVSRTVNKFLLFLSHLIHGIF